MKRSLIILLSAAALAAMFFSAPAAHAAISFDASSTKIFSSSTIATATVTVGSGSNEMLVIGIAASGTSAASVTVNGSAATKAIAASSTGQDAEIWYFPNAPSGAVNVSSSLGKSASGTIIISSYFGVGTSSPADASSSATASSKAPSASVTTKAANDWVTDMVAFAGGDTESAIGSGQTLINTSGTSYERAAASYKSTPISGATTTSWTLTSGNVRWEEVQFAFKQANPVPTITSLSPNATTTGGSTFTLTVNGTNFIASSTVDWNATALTTTYVSATQITASVPAADITTATTSAITVVNPAPGGGTSGSSNFTVNNPTPTISSLSPTSTTSGGSSFTLTITGTKFVSSSVAYWNGTSTALATTTANTATTIHVTVTATEISAVGSYPVYVVNPTPGGGTSNSSTFNVFGSGYTWVGGGGNSNWNNSANWSGNAVPGPGNTATFSSSYNTNCTINASVNVGGINIMSGYTGTITQGSGDTITVGSSGWAQSAGTFTGSSGADTITMNGAFSLSGGTFTSTNGTISFASSTTFSGGTFNNASGIAEFITTSTSAVASGSATFYDLVLGNNFGGTGVGYIGLTIATGTTLTAQNYFYENTDGTETQLLGGGTIAVDGNIETSYSPAYEPSTVTVSLVGTGTQLVGDDTVVGNGYFDDFIMLPGFTIAKSSGVVDLAGRIDVFDNFTNTNATTINPGTSTVAIGISEYQSWPFGAVSTATSTSIITGTSTFYDLVFGGDNPGGSVNGQYTIATGTTLTVQDDLYFDSNYTSIQLLGGGTVDVQNNIESGYEPGYVNSTPSIVLDGTSTQIVGDDSWSGRGHSVDSLIIPDLTIQNSSGVVYAEGNVAVTGNISVNQGEFQLSTSSVAGTVAVGGPLTVASGARLSDYPAATSTVVLSSVVNNGVVWFDGGNETGCSSPYPQYVVLNSTTTGQQVPWSGSGTFIMRYTQVQDQGGTANITDTNGTSVSNNGSNWSFPTGPVAYLVQMASTSVSSGSSITITFPFSPRSGDLVIVSVFGTNSGEETGFTDTGGGDSYQRIFDSVQLVPNSVSSLWYAPDVSATSTFAITATYNNGPAVLVGEAFDFTDMSQTSTYDGEGASNGYGLTISSPIVMGHSSNELYFGYVIPNSSSTTLMTGSPGWTQEPVLADNSGQSTYVQYFAASSTPFATSSAWTMATNSIEVYPDLLAVFSTGGAPSGYPASGTLDSATFDTKSASGATLNSITWNGPAQPAGTDVGFQLAVSNSPNGPWNFEGPSGNATTYFGYGSSPGATIPLVSNVGGAGYAMFSGYRYFRYRVALFADSTDSYTPVVSSVNVNWSP